MHRFDGAELAALQTALGGAKIARAPLALFYFLWKCRGIVVAWDDLINKLESSYVHFTPIDVRDVQNYLKKVRRAIRENDWPCKIETFYGIGVKLTATDPNWGTKIP